MSLQATIRKDESLLPRGGDQAKLLRALTSFLSVCIRACLRSNAQHTFSLTKHVFNLTKCNIITKAAAVRGQAAECPQSTIKHRELKTNAAAARQPQSFVLSLVYTEQRKLKTFIKP